MLDHAVFLHRSVNIPRRDLVPKFERRNKMPYLGAVERRLVNATRQIGSHLDTHRLQGALDSIVNIGQKARSKLYRQRRARGNHLVSTTNARRLLVDLNRRTVTVHLNDFSNQSLVSYANYVKHVRFSHSLRYYQRTRYL